MRFSRTVQSRSESKTITGIFGRRLRRVLLTALLSILFLHVFFIVITSATLLVYKRFNPLVTGVMVYRVLFYRWKIQPVKYIPLEKIPLNVRRMVVNIEDGYFYSHKGIRMDSLKNAWKANKRLGKAAHGGSTITMQTARTIFLCPEKNYLRKYLELIITLEMEAILDKDRILELYLNYAEWGKGVFGVGAASRYYYNKEVRGMTTDQSIRLVALLSSPILYGPKTIHKSGSLRWRYGFLTERYGAPPAE
jgi:monofunctional biosynthetic peptidoglycan transglycosylase